MLPRSLITYSAPSADDLAACRRDTDFGLEHQVAVRIATDDHHVTIDLEEPPRQRTGQDLERRDDALFGFHGKCFPVPITGLRPTMQYDRIVLIPKRGGAATPIPGVSALHTILTRGHPENPKHFPGTCDSSRVKPARDVIAYQGLVAGSLNTALALSRREIVTRARRFLLALYVFEG